MNKGIDLWARDNKKRQVFCKEASELVVRLNRIIKELSKLDSHGDLKELCDRFRSLEINATCERISIEARSHVNDLNRCAYEWSFLDYWRD